MEKIPQWVSRYQYDPTAQIHRVQIDRTGFVMLEVDIQGQKLLLMFDTGSSSSIILYSDQFDSLHLTVAEKARVYSEHVWESVLEGTADQVSVLGTIKKDVPVVRTTWPQFDRIYKGVLGPSIFSDHRITIDYHTQTVGVTDKPVPRSMLTDKRVIAVPMITCPIKGRIFMWMNLNNKTALVNLDTGASRCVLEMKEGNGTSISIKQFDVSDLRVGADVKVDCINIKTFLERNIEFVLGSNVLKKYLVTLDYVGHQVCFEKY